MVWESWIEPTTLRAISRQHILGRMATQDFDALGAARDLENDGFEKRQADTIVETVRAGRAGLATRADLDALEGRIETRFAALEARLTTRFFGGLAAVGGSIVAAIKLLQGMARTCAGSAALPRYVRDLIDGR